MQKIRFYLPLVFLFSLWVATRFYHLKSGLHLLEPDEWEYLQIAHSFKNSWVPLWHGQPYFLQLPLFPLLAHGVNFKSVTSWWGHFGPVRIISVLASGLYSFWAYRISRQFFTRRVALWTSALWLITPLLWFYSRQGTPDFLALAFSWGGVYYFLRAIQKRKVSLSILAGVWFALGILAKTNAVIFLSLPAVWFLVSLPTDQLWRFPTEQLRRIFLFFTKRSPRRSRSSSPQFPPPETTAPVVYRTSFITLATIGLIVFLILLPLYLIFKHQFITGISTHPRLFLVTHLRANLALLWEYLKIFPWWFSRPVVGLIGMGLVILLAGLLGPQTNSISRKIATAFVFDKNKFRADLRPRFSTDAPSAKIYLRSLHLRTNVRNFRELEDKSKSLAMMLVALGIGQTFLLGWWYFSPRNGLLAFSGGFLLIAISLNWLFHKFPSALASTAVMSFLFILIFATGGLTAYSATQHLAVEASLEWIREHQEYLAHSHPEFNSGSNQIPDQARNDTKLPVYTTFDAEKLTEISGFEVNWLNSDLTSPAWIITDREKTDRISSLSYPTFTQAKQVIKDVKSTHPPVETFIDPLPLFPVTKMQNLIQVYKLP
jgi:hypothetical protein